MTRFIRPMKLEVKRSHVEDSVPWDPRMDPIARALAEAIPLKDGFYYYVLPVTGVSVRKDPNMYAQHGPLIQGYAKLDKDATELLHISDHRNTHCGFCNKIHYLSDLKFPMTVTLLLMTEAE